MINLGGKEEKLDSPDVENPKTGIYYGYGVLILIIIVGSITYILTRKKSKFPQA